MKKILSAAICPTRISPPHGGQAAPKTGGNWQQKMIIGVEDLYGPVLTTVVNPRHLNGRISARISGSWMCVVSQKISITIINPGGQTQMYCIFHRIGTGATSAG